MVEVCDTPSILLRGMTGSRLPVVVSHGEGRAQFADAQQQRQAEGHVGMRFIENTGLVTERYPFNPNGSPGGITALTSSDGRCTIMMPHPERCARTLNFSWHPPESSYWGEQSPWLQMFVNARRWVG